MMSDVSIQQTAFPSAFSLRLPDSVHEAAALESELYSNVEKAEQVYLSHLAQYASGYYLQVCGYSLRQRVASTLNFVDRALSDSATVDVAGYGQLACIIVSEKVQTLEIPTSALVRPVGYLAIAFDDDLRLAEVVGFVEQTEQAEVASSAVRSLAELPGYLAQINPVSGAIVQLNRWWERSFDRGWSLVSELTNEEPMLAFRGADGSRQGLQPAEVEEDLEDGLVCHKALSLQGVEGQTFSLILMMERFANASSSIRIVARLMPTVGQSTLLEGVELAAADESKTVFSSVRSRQQSPFVELRFRADPGDYFSLKVSFDGVAVTEAFVV